jgi:FixJ family two-component response regulator
MGSDTLESPIVAVIDDDDSVREALRSLLRSLEFAVETFESAEDFLDSPCATRAGCVIVDVRLQGMSGLDLQRAMLDSGRGRPIIFITAHDEDSARRRAIAAGALAFLSKPFTEQALIRAVRGALPPDGSAGHINQGDRA